MYKRQVQGIEQEVRVDLILQSLQFQLAHFALIIAPALRQQDVYKRQYQADTAISLLAVNVRLPTVRRKQE